MKLKFQVSWEVPYSSTTEEIEQYLRRELRHPANISVKEIKKPADPRPHADLIHQWADDRNLVIERYMDEGWTRVPYPSWSASADYRIRPKELKKEDSTLSKIMAKVKTLNTHNLDSKYGVEVCMLAGCYLSIIAPTLDEALQLMLKKIEEQESK